MVQGPIPPHAESLRDPSVVIPLVPLKTLASLRYNQNFTPGTSVTS
jgi:hypothetical protein